MLVGLCGPAGCGKDTVGDVMASNHGFTKYALAGPIKHGLNSMFHWSMEQWNNRDWKEAEVEWLGKSPRYLAQTLGTEWGRQFVRPDLWLLLGMRKWEEVGASTMPRLVITDIRFDNEAEAILNAGGTVWKVDRAVTGPVARHVSENGVSDSLIVGHVKNNGTLEDLEVEVFSWLQLVRQRYAT